MESLIRDGGRARAARHTHVTYWTGWLSPEMEGCSKDVFALKDHFPRSRVFGLSQHYTLKLSMRERYAGLNVRFYPVFRGVAPIYEWSSEISHIYGSLNDWYFLHVLGRRPLVLTAATEGKMPDRSLHRHVTRFVVHSTRTADALRHEGVSDERIRIIYPGLPLHRFAVAPRAAVPPGVWPGDHPGRFRVLFATTPNWEEGLETRGVHLIMRAAAQLPDVDFFLPWRPWDTGQALLDGLRARYGRRDNVHLSIGRVPDMARLFQAADATIAPFMTMAGTKICPTSIVEGLAAGRPALVSTEVGIADVIARDQCGEVFAPTVDGLCQAVQRLRHQYPDRAARARPCAERHFDQSLCFRRHEDLYADILAAS
jgi:glycosyltransferase involved in cell wall biosynthesis